MRARSELASLARGLRLRLEQEGDLPPAPRAAPSSSAAPAPGNLAELAARIDACRACPLGAARIKSVPGVGSANAQVMFIGEGPGYDEDRQGEPFVGRSGQLLDKIMASIGLSRETVFIANVVKCHPMKDPLTPDARGNDRPPTPAEMAACRPFLDEQIRLIGPKVIVTLGSSAARAMLGTEEPITKIRGQWRTYQPKDGPAVKLLPTFHPAALLRNPDLKRDVWTDMKNLKKEISNEA